MTRVFTNGKFTIRYQVHLLMDILRYYQLITFSHSTTFITFSYKSRRFSFQIVAKFEAAKTESDVGFLRLTTVSMSQDVTNR